MPAVSHGAENKCIRPAAFVGYAEEISSPAGRRPLLSRWHLAARFWCVSARCDTRSPDDAEACPQIPHALIRPRCVSAYFARLVRVLAWRRGGLPCRREVPFQQTAQTARAACTRDTEFDVACFCGEAEGLISSAGTWWRPRWAAFSPMQTLTVQIGHTRFCFGTTRASRPRWFVLVLRGHGWIYIFATEARLSARTPPCF